MPSLDPPQQRLVLLSLGTTVLLAAVFAPLGTALWTYEYTAEPVEPTTAGLDGWLSWPEKTAMCAGSCTLAPTVRDGGPRVVSAPTYEGANAFDREKTLVVFPNDDHAFYRPNATHYENGTVRVALTPVSNATALELASTPAREFPRGVQRIVREGTVRTGRPLVGTEFWKRTDAVVSYDGSYYRDYVATDRESMNGARFVVRMALLSIGVGLCYWAGRID
ncbi:hypothetical protein E6P09_08450 [Haloferax mediterranei ATCC 33500]|uniref:Uncharacterized protein n=1 Tax=Haloferax mediterranei (strain ATCC 33500 / DSM 1411 / JCM 8866 / NBRC 14739 / NCIMB 2177 / R-4) TaxID=523841 RepID=I3R3J0_HALMT|nr:hypothetical protein [Haloferax mediterranei]AFK18800.1 hypothetical protein HFX_1084 [Haloferax mediterranei ATCC 33500]AHZ21832.1 hypothetical protein BM92_03790 [Haloferax mediterranei ATCC 33500]EMA03341.1 hypothetical protein C439_05065 [Haloferax mediterranei ATCC 33500]MDX5988895.1 hypothetical protein [Haloferax mediterranei ATCC 33500]QCQ75292.1 hypothetical protein E6P09_08450 [Haloferax mediterranei ATCC 33500]